ncbi:MAG: helix-turn-helix transcriptional regulator [Eubacteriales bacterium]|jgi:transcriptional regulator with XRE-family HTH domain|nr:helix-turn-helix transcriptional regulator [Eubacteriales bacterium]
MKENYRERFRILGLKIAYYRKLRGMTQEQFAEAIGRSVSFVSQIEANNSSVVKGISMETLFLVSDKLNVSLSKLFEDV